MRFVWSNMSLQVPKRNHVAFPFIEAMQTRKVTIYTSRELDETNTIYILLTKNRPSFVQTPKRSAARVTNSARKAPPFERKTVYPLIERMCIIARDVVYFTFNNRKPHHKVVATEHSLYYLLLILYYIVIYIWYVRYIMCEYIYTLMVAVTAL